MDIVALMCTWIQGITYIGRTDFSVHYKSMKCSKDSSSGAPIDSHKEYLLLQYL